MVSRKLVLAWTEAMNGGSDRLIGSKSGHLPFARDTRSERSLCISVYIDPKSSFMSASLTPFAQSEARARQIEARIEDGKTQNGSLASTIKAIELYMTTLKLADNASDQKRIDAKCKELLSKAEKIKKSREKVISEKNGVASLPPQSSRPGPPTSNRELSKREEIILLEGGILNGFKFKAWEGSPSPEEFSLKNGDELFLDSPELSLSEQQLESFAGWKRPQEALASLPITDGKADPNLPTMLIGSIKVDLVQDMTSDCSVVASLCAGTARAERGHSRLMRTIIFPYDDENQSPSISKCGKYVLRMYFNGCWRRVQIDDRLPTSSNSRVLHVIDRSNPGLLWPALLEKAYLKVRGGYDFPGSNSGTDLAVITGWIPQQVFLHDEDIEEGELWRSIYDTFIDGDLLLTMGTGKLPMREQRQLGLASEHDYAVLNLKKIGDTGEMLVKNPWSNGDIWHGAAKCRPNPSQESSPDMSTTSLHNETTDSKDEMTPGTFWMDFRSVFQYFENIYINWNPYLFSYREDLHFSWNLNESSSPSNLFIKNPQFAVHTKKGGEVWLLLNRHFRTGDYSMATQGKNGYISLYLYKNDGSQVLSTDGALIRGPFVDSPNTLLKFKLPPNTTYTAVVASQDLVAGKYNFTLSAFSNEKVGLTNAICLLDSTHSVTAAWTRSTAGGNSDSRGYLQNPQFKIDLQSTASLALVLQIPSSGSEKPEVHVKIVIVFTSGGRITRLRERDIVASSGDYRRGSTVVQTQLDKGSYAVICSTFDPDQYATFKLDLLSPSTESLHLVPLPSESSGRFSIRSGSATFSTPNNRFLAPLSVPRLSRAIFILRPSSTGTSKSASLVKMTLEQGQGPYKQMLASSSVDNEEFSSISSDIRIEDMRLRPDMDQSSSGGLWLVVERMAQVSAGGGIEEMVQVEILAEERLELGSWGSGDG